MRPGRLDRKIEFGLPNLEVGWLVKWFGTSFSLFFTLPLLLW